MEARCPRVDSCVAQCEDQLVRLKHHFDSVSAAALVSTRVVATALLGPHFSAIVSGLDSTASSQLETLSFLGLQLPGADMPLIHITLLPHCRCPAGRWRVRKVVALTRFCLQRAAIGDNLSAGAVQGGHQCLMLSLSAQGYPPSGT